VLAAVLVVGLAIGGVLLARNSDGDSGSSSPTEPITELATESATESATEISSATVPTDVVTTAPATSRDAIVGTWTGVYVCAQGDTRLRLVLDRGPGPADLTAVFAFGPTEDNPDVPRGSYRMEGSLSDGLLDLHATTWIKKPAGYLTVDIEAPVVGEAPLHIAGEITGASGCSTFAVVQQA